MIADFFHCDGKKDVAQHRLKIDCRYGRNDVGRCLSRGNEIESRSSAVDEESEAIALESSDSEKGQQIEEGLWLAHLGLRAVFI